MNLDGRRQPGWIAVQESRAQSAFAAATSKDRQL
jgi:hypothetical protein